MPEWAPLPEDIGAFTYTGSTAISIEEEIVDYAKRIVSIELNLTPTVTSSESLVVNLLSNSGDDPVEIPWYIKDLQGIYSLIFYPDTPLLLEIGDFLNISYTNTDLVAYTLTINYVNRFVVWRIDS